MKTNPFLITDGEDVVPQENPQLFDPRNVSDGQRNAEHAPTNDAQSFPPRWWPGSDPEPIPAKRLVRKPR